MEQTFSLRDYQIEGIKRIKEARGRQLFCLPAGSGKTYTAIFMKSYYPFLQKILICCPSSIKLQWEQEIHRIFPKDKTVVLNGHYHKGQADSILSSDWVIINYDILEESNPSYYTWADVLSRVQFDMLIVDESHNIRNSDALRTKGVQKIATKIKNRVLLSGTPMSTNLENLYTQLNLVDATTFPTEKEYKNKYCSYSLEKIFARGKTIRFKKLLPPTKTHLDLLKNDMKNSVYIVSKEQVYQHLNPTTFSDIPCSIDEDEIRDEMKELIKNKDDSKKTKATFAHLMLALGMAKINFTVDFVKQQTEINDEKICIACYNRDVVTTLHDKLKNCSVCYYGEMDNEEKCKSVEAFINDSKIKYMIFNYNCITGLDKLNQVSNTIVFCQIPFTYSTYNQAMGRIKRVNSTFDRYFVYNIIATNDLDKAVFDTMKERQNITEALFANDSTVDGNEQSFIRDVLKKLKR